MKYTLPSAVFIGAGNVASAIAPALERSGAAYVTQVYSRTMANASSLAHQLRNAEPIADLTSIRNDADVYIISVKDDAIREIVEMLPGNDALWIHTSGGIGVDAIASLSSNTGVMYPLQTFTKGIDVDLSKVPFFVEGSNPNAQKRITELAGSLSGRVELAGSVQRLKLHAAAVFACNFVNHMLAVADDILQEAGTDLSVLRPLIDETMRKITLIPPSQAQTGPARRGDNAVMERHLSVLDSERGAHYKYISQMISQYYRNERNKL